MCKDCMTGALHTGTPRGTVTTLHGLPTYVTQPPSGTSTAEPTGVVILISDAFGWEVSRAASRFLLHFFCRASCARAFAPPVPLPLTPCSCPTAASWPINTPKRAASPSTCPTLWMVRLPLMHRCIRASACGAESTRRARRLDLLTRVHAGHWLAHDMLSSVETALDSKSPITSRLYVARAATSYSDPAHLSPRLF